MTFFYKEHAYFLKYNWGCFILCRVIEGESLYRGLCGEFDDDFDGNLSYCACGDAETGSCQITSDTINCPITPQEEASKFIFNTHTHTHTYIYLVLRNFDKFC